MPLDDWQFYVVTVIAIAGVWSLVRALVPARRKSAGTRTTLTVEGRKPR